jgi:hypothetical protein
VAGRLSFEEVLDEALAAHKDAAGARFWTGPQPAFFVSFHGQRSASLASARIRSGQLPATKCQAPIVRLRQGFGGQAQCRLPNAECRTPARALTAREQEALDHLVALGARLGADFTARELRSAFRELARRYHPDRHPAGSTAEIADVTRVFATMSAHYQSLLAAIE